MSIARKIKQGADAIDARTAFDPEVRKKVANASEIAYCLRKQWYAKNLEDQPEQSWGYARRGKNAERYMVEALQAANVPLCGAGDDQETVSNGVLSATPDGYIWNEDGETITCVEFKSIDPRTNRANLPKYEHVVQLQLGMALLAEVKGLRPTHGVIVYIDASNYDDIVEHRVMYDPAFLDEMTPRAQRLLRTREVARLPREGAQKGGKECSTMCPFKTVCKPHLQAVQISATPARGNRGSRLHAAVEDYSEAKEREDDAKADKADAAERIKAELAARKVNKIEVGNRVVSLTTRAGSVSYAQVVKHHCPDVDLEPYRGAPTEVLTVK